MKKMYKILILWITLVWLIIPMTSFAWIVNLPDVLDNNSTISWANWTSDDLSSTVESVGVRILSTAKYIFSWILLIIIVYAGALMITSMWNDEENLSKWKRILRYSVIWIFFINMPWTIYNAIKWDRTTVSWWISSSWWNNISSSDQSLFINTDVFVATINNTVIRFIKIGLVGLAVMVIILAWIKIMTSRWREDKVTEAKSKILWSIIWLIFVWFIDIWQRFVYKWEVEVWTDIFKTIANLALFLAAPTAIFFLCLAWYYYITAAWDEEKTKKWKNIIINVVIAIVILLVSCIFLYDLITL